MGTVKTETKDREDSRAGSAASLGDYVYESLRGRLRDGRLQPGDRLNVVKLAEELGVSRTPVQEAMNRLERDGFLAFQPRRGAIIIELEPGQAAELYVMREMLHGKAARLAAQHASEVEIRTLWDLLNAQAQSVKDIPEFIRLNQLFHDAIFQMAHNRYLLQAVNMFHSSLALLRSTHYFVPGRPETAYSEHVAIFEAIKRHDSDGAEKAMLEHIQASEHLRRNREFGV